MGVGGVMDSLQGALDFVRTTPAFPAGFTAWDFFNSNLLLAIVGAAFTLVFKTATDRQRKNQDAQIENEVQRSREIVDEQDADVLKDAESKPTFREAAKIIDDFKVGIESAVEKSEGRYQRTYRKIARYDYIPLIDSMMERNLPLSIGALLKEAFTIFKTYKNGRNEVPEQVLNRLRAIRSELKRSKFLEV